MRWWVVPSRLRAADTQAKIAVSPGRFRAIAGPHRRLQVPLTFGGRGRLRDTCAV